MAVLKEVSMGITDSIKVDDYQYVKPSVHMTIVVDPKEDYDKACSDLREELIDRMQQLRNAIEESH